MLYANRQHIFLSNQQFDLMHSHLFSSNESSYPENLLVNVSAMIVNESIFLNK